MENVLSRVGLISIALLILYIIYKLFEGNLMDEETSTYKLDEEDENDD